MQALDLRRLFLDPKGRIPRIDWWLGTFSVWLAGAIALMLARLLAPFPSAMRLNSLIIACILAVASFCIDSKRLHDLGHRSGLAALLAALHVAFAAAHVLIPNLFFYIAQTRAWPSWGWPAFGGWIAFWGWVFFLLGAKIGEAGPNRFGPDPFDPGPGAGRA